MVEIVPAPGVTVDIGGNAHAGTLDVSASDGGLVLVEEASLDDYLLGIAEVPFSWPEEALRAQVIAARTYLAWTLERGRSSNGRSFGYDICATDACQVYRGLSGVSGTFGDRWRSAVSSTSDQILLADGEPLQALYSSTSGGRTRSVEDVFGGSPNPYLKAVPSPSEASPFVDWRFPIETGEMAALAEQAGHLEGELLTVRTVTSDDGEGPWIVEFVGTEGTVGVPTWRLRTDLNRAARAVFPDRFPVRRPDRPDLRYPQTIMSPTYVVTEGLRYETRPDGRPAFVPFYEVRGQGWGHLVGMSQYGAEAMASGGATADEILAHYYSGLRPVEAPEVLPDTVRIGLSTSAESLTLSPDGPVTVLVDGRAVATDTLGTWTFLPDGDSVVVTPPVGLGLPPEIEGLVVVERHGAIVALTGRLVSAAEVDVRVVVNGVVSEQREGLLLDAGEFALPIDVTERMALVRITIESASPQGSDVESIVHVGGAR